MNRRKLYLSIAIAVSILIAVVFIVRASTGSYIKVNPAFKGYISAFTSGMISTSSTIKIELSEDYTDTTMIGKTTEEELFDFSPSIKGKSYWLDRRTIEFRPDNKLTTNQLYTAKFLLNKIIKVPDSLRVFEFQFKTRVQAFEVIVENHKAYDNNKLNWEKLNGKIITADYVDIEKMKKVLSATQEGRKLNVNWSLGANSKTFLFQLDSINRKEEQSEVLIKWNGKEISSETKGEQKIVIRSLNDFDFLSVDVVQLPDQYLLLQFSDPIMAEQELQGLIKLDGLSNLKFIIEDNQIRIYPSVKQTGRMTLSVFPHIKNSAGKKLNTKIMEEIVFEDIKPAVRLMGNGVILPSSNGLIFPFEAVNLKAVDVKILKIYENNIAQFLQVNELNGERELRRVGKVIFKKKVDLQSASTKKFTNYSRWNKFSLDLSKLISTEPGAIYRVTLSFNKKHSLYPCDEDSDEDDQAMESIDDAVDEDDDEDWDYYSDYDYYYYDYDWNERDNPCDNAYYMYKHVSRNVLASDIGLIAKKGSDGSLNVFTTNLLTAKPISGVKLEFYDFRQQLLKSISTDADGKASVKLKKRPYLLIAKNKKQRGYLKLNDGSSLSLSMFDTDGAAVNKGVKGYIYGERGVWRPGDTLFLSFILEDKLNTLPASFPVVFDLFNAKGQKYKHIVRTNSLNGFYTFIIATHPDDPTGSWKTRVKVGGASFTKYLKVETVKPNRLKIDLDFGKEKLIAGQDNSGILEASWLHGAIARNLKAKVTMTLTKRKTIFKKYPSYIFDDPAKRYYSQTTTIFDSRLDESGKANIKPTINNKDASPGMLTASFNTKVFEESGNFSIDMFSKPFYPYSSYVGVSAPKGDGYYGVLLVDKKHNISIVNLDVDGKSIKDNKVRVELYKVSWRWWWDNSGYDLSSYVNSQYKTPVSKKTVKVKNGRAIYSFKVDKSEWGRYLIRFTDLESGHSTGKVVYVDWPGWQRRSREGQEKITMLSFTSDKEKYNVGETIKLNIPTGESGRALISVETGSKVLESYWLNTSKGSTNFEIPVKPEMAPNVYIHITLMQPHAQSKNDLPMRLYGVIPVQIEDPNTHLRPIVKMPDVIRPERKVSINVSEENGKAMTYTLAIVDEGLLDLTNFKTPDPWNHFYAREALGVKTWDMFDYVMGAYGGALERVLSIGGDGTSSGKTKAAKAQRFKPMVKFVGPFYLSKGQNKTHVFNMPKYVGSVRVMVVAGDNAAYGSAEKSVKVRKPLMILGTLPRVVGPGETVKLPVNVFAMEKEVKNVSVSIKTNDIFTIKGPRKQAMKFKKVGDKIVNFELKIKEKTGIGKVEIYAVSGNEKATFSIEIDVRNANPPMVDVVETVVKPGDTWSTDYNPLGMSGTNLGTIEVSSIPPINLEKRLKYLVQYPHGCIEQVTSSVFPQLYLSGIMDLDDKMKKKIENNVKAGINKLRSFQANSGGFSYWPGRYQADSWGSSYAGHFLLEASKMGYSVPKSMLKKWRKYQKQKAVSWTFNRSRHYYNTDLLQAYRLYTLALAKAPQLGAMNRLKQESELSLAARWRLAAAYQMAGHKQAAKMLVVNASTSVKAYTEMSTSYGSNIRDKAMIIETLCLMNQKTKAAGLVKQLSRELSQNQWMSTQTTAYCLLAVSKFVKDFGSESGVNFTYYLRNNSAVTKSSQKTIATVDMNLKGSNKTGKLKLKNNSKGIMYVRLILEGVPMAGDEKYAENNIKMKLNYKNMKGLAISPLEMIQGSDFIAEVSITNPGMRGNYQQLALTQIFPSGWEIHNARLFGYDSRMGQSSSPTYQDIRDDRVYTYFDLKPNETKTFRLMLNSSYLGKFYLPSLYCEAMYDNSIYARIPGKWVKVISSDGETALK